MKVVIYSYPFNWRYGGLVVLNKLADLISKLGYDTYIIDKEKKSEKGKAIRILRVEAFEIVKNQNTIVIYPEIVRGNPLNAPHVARWVLYFPGINGGDKIYDDSEFIFTYNPEFVAGTDYSLVPVIRVVDTMANQFYDMGLTRTKDAILVKKGSHNLERRRQLYLDPAIKFLYGLESADQMIKDSQSMSEFNQKLNQIRYFISYDHHTYHNVLAALAGCKSIVIPEEGKSRQEFFSENPERALSISYGFQSKGSEHHSPELLRIELEKLDSANLINAHNLMVAMRSNFKM